jgi:hypothetical protein
MAPFAAERQMSGGTMARQQIVGLVLLAKGIAFAPQDHTSGRLAISQFVVSR